MKRLSFFLLLFVTAISQAQHINVQISAANAPEEPSITINPKTPRYLAAGSNIRNAYYSSDTGRTWNSLLLTSTTYGVYGDPALVCDTQGNFYFFHLADPPGTPFLDRIVSQKSTNNGVSYDNGTSIGFNSTKVQDKQWGIVDRRNNNIYVTWTQFDVYGSNNPADSSHILFSRSTDAGLNWSTPVRLDQKGGDCVDDDNTVEGAVPAVGPNGEIYVAWAGPLGLVFDRSLDAGNTWMTNDKVIGPIPGGWAFDVPGIYRANGMPITVCDVSNGPHRGNIYVNWGDQRNGTTDTDIWFTRSSDGGNTWSNAIRVNDDAAGKQQFFSWMSIDQTNGYIYIVFYDRRNYTDVQTDVWMARSTDGGATFKNFKISDSPFAPSNTVFFGDYSNLTVHKGIIRPIWTRLDAGALSVWTALVDTTLIPGVVTGVGGPDPNVENINAYPNPFTNNSFLSFKLKKPGLVTLQIIDAAGKLVAKPIDKKFYATGKYTEHLDIGKLKLSPGVYFYRVTINGRLYSQKIIHLQ